MTLRLVAIQEASVSAARLAVITSAIEESTASSWPCRPGDASWSAAETASVSSAVVGSGKDSAARASFSMTPKEASASFSWFKARRSTSPLMATSVAN